MLRKLDAKKVSKIISCLVLIFILASAATMVMGSMPTALKPSGTAPETVSNLASYIIYFVQIIAFAVAVIMLIVLAIKYLTASPEGKAEIKKSAVIYIVGAIILFAATGILGIIKNFADNNISDTSTSTPNP